MQAVANPSDNADKEQESGAGNTYISLRNPFKLPKEDIFLLRNQQHKKKRQEREHQKGLKVHQKCTYLGKIQETRAEFRQELEKWEKEADTKTANTSLRNNPSWKKAAVRDRNDESMVAYITKKKEMFMLEYSLAVKQELMTNLAEVAKVEENRLQRAAQFLEEDAAMFDEFLKENDKSSVQAIKIAEKETKAKLEKIADIKRITGTIVTVKSDISKFEDILKDYTNFNEFLLKLSPPEWQEKQQWRREMAQKIRAREKQQQTAAKAVQGTAPTTQSRRRESSQKELPPVTDPRSLRKVSTKENKMKEPPVPEIEGNLSEYEDPQIFFTDPQQLLDLLTELEKQNLNLIQNSQDTEESLEEFRITMCNTRKKMEQETEQLSQQVDIISCAIERERVRAAELELKARLFSFGEFKADTQDRMLEGLGLKVKEVYQLSVGETEANLTTLQMLTIIEGRMEELVESLELVPRDRLLVVDRVREKERRIKQREEKVFLQKKQQEERLRKALERAQTDIKRPLVRKLVPRSQPPMQADLDAVVDEGTNVELENHQYFFT
ncbi:cilia- and flagella-associated protein 100-like isoform X2 [Clupea harengus]|uniref:Cilia- and flagella-associated protein 100-like isoform X2 n=1 Tax=Clupea harengus TaxID=7950 RepID=A0A6P8FES8_CLUHA|nr:cilia- and flagella-associated protein 100-like isoform X2 [Clupea harengus]